VSPHIRRIIYVTTYEIIAIIVVTFLLSGLGYDGVGSGVVAVVSSTVALTWNYIWTTMFEAWEKRQESKTRTLKRRVAHAIGFEGGLVIFLTPVLALILQVGILEAFTLQIGMLVFFLIYTFVFAWVFDLVLPPRHLAEDETDEDAGDSLSESDAPQP
jgi:uncharacterized membrane protein